MSKTKTVFLAKYPGVCGECEEWFTPGTECYFDDRHVIRHVHCELPAPHTSVCPKCNYMVHSNGTCGC